MKGFKPSDLPPALQAQLYAQTNPLAPRLRHAQPEQAPVLPPLGQNQDEEGGGGRFKVRIVRCGAKLLDPDNLSGAKLLIDQLRYAGLIPEDNPHAIELELCQVKTPKKEDRGTLIQVEQLP